MSEWPRISIVTPSYNQGIFIERTIQSVLNQNYPNLEYIIIDGGSTDNSVDIIRKYSHRLTYWVSEKDNGQAHAINKGFHRATGDIVGWLNSDDEYCPGTLEKVTKTFMAHKDVDLVFGDRISVDENGRVLRYDRHTRFTFSALVLYGMIVSQPATFWKRNLFEKYGYLDESLHFCMDYEFLCRLGTHIETKHIRRFLAKFRKHSCSKSCTIMHVAQMELGRIREMYLAEACKGYPKELALLAVYLYRAFWYSIQGDASYVIRGICRRILPKSLRPIWL